MELNNTDTKKTEIEDEKKIYYKDLTLVNNNNKKYKLDELIPIRRIKQPRNFVQV